jgi:hypothetical protein
VPSPFLKVSSKFCLSCESLEATLDKSPSRALCSTLLASLDVIPFLEASLEHLGRRPVLSPELLLAVLCLRVLQFYLRFGLPSSDVWCCRSRRLGFAMRVMPLAVDALPCWPWQMLCRRCRLGFAVRVMPPARGYFAALALADTLPSCCLGGCFAAVPISSRWILCHHGIISPTGSLLRCIFLAGLVG